MALFDIAFSPDRRRMVSGGDKLIVWETATWQQVARYKLLLQEITFIQFSLEGNDLITSERLAHALMKMALLIWNGPNAAQFTAD